MRDALRRWWLVLRCSWIGAALGAVPGMGAAVIDWLAYGHALKTEKQTQRFGEGDIRGVIASESSNNAKEGGALVPTLAFGVPGSASMAILLGAFTMHGLVPGPRMLGENLEVTYSIVWSLALANVLGAGLCLAFSNQLARVATLRVGLLVPAVLAVIFLGAFQGSRQWGDLYVLLGFGVFGWVMKRQGWPRPPLILGVVLGDIVERYLFISVNRYEWTWISRPLVIAFFALAVIGLVGPLLRNLHAAARRGSGVAWRARFSAAALFTLAVMAGLAVSAASASQWNFEARIVPLAVVYTALVCAALSLCNEIFLRGAGAGPKPAAEGTVAADGLRGLDVQTALMRAAGFFAWCGGYFLLARLTGMLIAMAVFIVLFVRLWGHESLARAVLLGVSVTAFSWLLFDQILAIPWPQNLLGEALPALRPWLR